MWVGRGFEAPREDLYVIKNPTWLYRVKLPNPLPGLFSKEIDISRIILVCMNVWLLWSKRCYSERKCVRMYLSRQVLLSS